MREREIGACDLEEFGDHHKKKQMLVLALSR